MGSAPEPGAGSPTTAPSSQLRALPGIDRLLDGCRALVETHGRALVTAALRTAVADARGAVLGGAPAPTSEQLIAAATAHLAAHRPAPLQPVINATGVVVHTNLGRAPLADAARTALLDAAGYCDLEYDLATGRRGSRVGRLEPLLCRATGAPAALAVNNAAAALVLALAALASGRDVIVSRGELIEIGGSFRLPDIMGASGARLVEVGTTNRTRADDYLAGSDAGAILTLHPSNYRIVGFVARPSVPELARVADDRGIPLIFDVGSGLLRPAGGALDGEPDVSTALGDGASLVLCSGDKLLGGPQAGLIFGRRELVEACRGHPLARAFRLDKLRIAALQATLELHLREARDLLPVWAMLTADPDVLADRVKRIVEQLTARGLPATATTVTGVPGGGSAPDAALPGPAVRLSVRRPDALAARLRNGRPPIIVRIADEALVVDLRTVDTDDDELLVERLLTASGGSGA